MNEQTQLYRALSIASLLSLPIMAIAGVRINVATRHTQDVDRVVERVSRHFDGELVRAMPHRRFLTVSVPEHRVESILADAELSHICRYVERDQFMEIPERAEWTQRIAAGLPLIQPTPVAPAKDDSTPNDPGYSNQYGMQCIDAEAAWDYSPGDSRVIVSIVDTGIDLSHADLQANINTDLDWDFVGNDNRPKDDMGHGTHIAGVIAGVSNNNVGIAGLAQVSLVGIKSVNWLGLGRVSDVVAGVYHAGDIGSHFVNMSLGFTSDVAALRTAIKEITAEGTQVIAAAGNSGNQATTYPAAYPEVIGVSALKEGCSQLASFSSYGTQNVEIAAPGQNIYSTLPDHSTWYNRAGLFPLHYGLMSGTSMACPHVVGIAAGYKAYDFDLTPHTIRNLMNRFADNLGDPARFGSGRVDYFPFAD